MLANKMNYMLANKMNYMLANKMGRMGWDKRRNIIKHQEVEDNQPMKGRKSLYFIIALGDSGMQWFKKKNNQELCFENVERDVASRRRWS